MENLIQYGIVILILIGLTFIIMALTHPGVRPRERGDT